MGNPIVPCNTIPSLDLSPWKEMPEKSWSAVSKQQQQPQPQQLHQPQHQLHHQQEPQQQHLNHHNQQHHQQQPQQQHHQPHHQPHYSNGRDRTLYHGPVYVHGNEISPIYLHSG